MNKKYKEIKPLRYWCDYENLFKALENKNISFEKMRKDLDISKEDTNKIKNHELIDLSKIGSYLDISEYHLYYFKGKYDFTNDDEVSKWCDEMRSSDYSIEYCDLGYGGNYEFILRPIVGLPVAKAKASTFTMGIGGLHDQFTHYKETGTFPAIFD